jgi:glutamine synthetase adenylyltransferase
VADGLRAELNSLENSRILPAEDVGTLRQTYQLWQRMRLALAVLAFDADVVPENPDKLDALAEVLKNETGNDLLRAIQQGQADVRRIFDKGVRRLQEW